MMMITVLGIDLAKSVFQLHGNNQNGKVTRFGEFLLNMGSFSTKETPK
jgi:hypothetical protein